MWCACMYGSQWVMRMPFFCKRNGTAWWVCVRVCVCLCVYVCVYERESVIVCVCLYVCLVMSVFAHFCGDAHVSKKRGCRSLLANTQAWCGYAAKCIQIPLYCIVLFLVRAFCVIFAWDLRQICAHFRWRQMMCERSHCKHTHTSVCDIISTLLYFVQLLCYFIFYATADLIWLFSHSLWKI